MASLAGYGPCGRPVHNMVFFGRVVALWFGRFKTWPMASTAEEWPFMAEPFVTWYGLYGRGMAFYGRAIYNMVFRP